MTWNITITDPRQKHFRKLPQKEQSRVKAVLLSMESDPFQGDLKRLKISSASKGNLPDGAGGSAITASFNSRPSVGNPLRKHTLRLAHRPDGR